MDTQMAIPRGDLAGCIAQSLRILRDVGQHLRGPRPSESRALDLEALARLDAFVARTNDRAASIMSALELQSVTAAKAKRVCSAGTPGAAGAAAWWPDDIRNEPRA